MNHSGNGRNKGRKPEKYIKAIFFVLLFTFVGGGAYLYFNEISSALQNPIGLTFALLVGASLLFIFLDRSMRIIAETYFNTLIRNITSWFFTIDPIEILDNYIVDLKENTAKIRRQMHRLRSQMHLLEEEIVNNRKEIKATVAEAQEAKEERDEQRLAFQARKSGRLEKSTERLETLLAKMKKVYNGLEGMKNHSVNMSEDLADQLELKRKERMAIQSSHSAMEEAMEMLDQKGEATKEFDDALEEIADDVSRKVGEMEHYMKLSDEFLKTMDLKKGVVEDEGLKKLDQWQKRIENTSKIKLDPPMKKEAQKESASYSERSTSSDK